MRHYDTSCGPMSCIPKRKDGVPEFLIKPPILSCSGIATPLVKLQVWSFYIYVIWGSGLVGGI